jgi:hypothetical protein
MSRTFHPYGRPCWRRPITHKVHWKRWRRFIAANPYADPNSVPGQWGWVGINWRWPKQDRVPHNRKLRHKVNRMVRFIDHEAVALPILLEQYCGWYL